MSKLFLALLCLLCIVSAGFVPSTPNVCDEQECINDLDCYENEDGSANVLCCYSNTTEHNVCMFPAELGEHCDSCRWCSSGVCVNNICVLRDGNCPCSDYDCPNFECECKKQLKGDICSNTTDCIPSLTCVNSVCTGGGKLGDSCYSYYSLIYGNYDTCDANLYCFNGTCKAKIENGNCTYSDQCVTGACINNYCNSTYCDKQSRCKKNWYCVESTCIQAFSIPDNYPCDNSQTCQSGVCMGRSCLVRGNLTLDESCYNDQQCQTGYCDGGCREFKTGSLNDDCSGDNDCEPGLICSGSLKCSTPHTIREKGLCSSSSECGVNMTCMNSVCIATEGQPCVVDANCAMTQYCGCDSSNTSVAIISGILSCIYDEEVAQEAINAEAAEAICGRTYQQYATNLMSCPANISILSPDEIPDDCHRIIANDLCCRLCRTLDPTFLNYRVDCDTMRIVNVSAEPMPCCGFYSYDDCWAEWTSNCNVYLERSNTQNETAVAAPIHKAKLGGGAVAGIVIGVLVGILLVIAFVFYFMVIRKTKKKHDVELSNVSLVNDKHFKFLSNIEVKEKLGSGQFGEVYRGIWNGSTEVALKKPRSDDDFKELEKEATILQNLLHPKIVQFYGLYRTDNGDRYIVTEYMNGSLLSLLQKESETMTVVELLHMALDAASGMTYLSDEKIIHRDLALRNLLVSNSGGPVKYVVKVADFGMSRLVEANYYKSEDKQIPVKWCPPEVINFGKYSTQSDVWSLGITFWEIFSYGAIPYPGMSNKETVKELNQGYRHDKPEDCPEEMYTIMKEMWSQNPEDRPTFRQVSERINALLRTLEPQIEREAMQSSSEYAPNEYTVSSIDSPRTPHYDSRNLRKSSYENQ